MIKISLKPNSCCLLPFLIRLSRITVGAIQQLICVTILNVFIFTETARSSVIDFSHISVTSPVSVGVVLPSTCSIGQLFFLVTAPAGQNLFGCTSANIWTSESNALPQVGAGSAASTSTNSSTQTSTPTTVTSAGSSAGNYDAANSSVAVSFSSVQSPIPTGVGQSITITADRFSTWSLTPGSLGTITGQSGNTVIYAAPSSVPAQNVVAGCMVLPNDSVFNVPINNLPVSTNSSQWIAQTSSIGAVGITVGTSWTANVVDSSLPATIMTFHYTTQRNGTPYLIPFGSDRYRENGSVATNGDNDHHLIAINHQTCHIYETYQDTVTAGPANTGYAASGWDYLGSGYSQPSSYEGGGTTNAAGLPLLPLTMRLSEIESGKISHALRFTSCAGCISSSYLWPAVGSTGGASAAAPMGSRWRLKSSFDISTFSPIAQVLLVALQQYGMFLSDIGGINQIQADADLASDPAVIAALQEIAAAKITSTSFDVVDETSLMISSDSNRISSSNRYVIPPNSANLTATDSNGNVMMIPFMLQPITVGTPFQVMNIQANTAIQLNAWVNGSTSTGVHWVVSSGPGSISANGLYTPPESVNAPTPFVLTATAQADGGASATVRGNVIPSGAIRVDVGSPSAYTDSTGRVWMPDRLGLIAGNFANVDNSYPASLWNNILDWPLYATRKYTWGDDISYSFAVPNGNYRVQFLFARSDCSGSYDPSTLYGTELTAGGTIGLEAQGQLSLFDIGAATHDSCRTPTTAEIPALVTDNILHVALRSISSTNTQESPSLNGLQILPQ